MDRREFRELLGSRVVRQEGDGDGDQFSVYASVDEFSESMTRQSDADAADINKIVSRFERSGVMPLTAREGRFLDVSEVGDYRSALEQVRRANEYFETLPASSRAMFGNDPAVFLDKVNDPAALQLLVDAGVVPKDEVKPVVATSSESGEGASKAP